MHLSRNRLRALSSIAGGVHVCVGTSVCAVYTRLLLSFAPGLDGGTSRMPMQTLSIYRYMYRCAHTPRHSCTCVLTQRNRARADGSVALISRARADAVHTRLSARSIYLSVKRIIDFTDDEAWTMRMITRSQLWRAESFGWVQIVEYFGISVEGYGAILFSIRIFIFAF